MTVSANPEGDGDTAQSPRPPRPVPDIPDGWLLAPPDFVGVGTERSGTTWWFALIAQHPRVVVNSFSWNGKSIPLKEIHFFDQYQGVSSIDPALYHRYFPRPRGMMAGEWTPRYMSDYWMAPMLRQAAPDPKILVMLRDPVERYLSDVAYTTASCLTAEQIAEMPDIESRGYTDEQMRERLRLINKRMPADRDALTRRFFTRGLYGQQLGTLLAYFPAEQILPLQYEQCVRDVTGQARRTLEFIGLDPSDWPGLRTTTRINQAMVPHPDLGAATIEALAAAYRADASSIFDTFPDLDPDLWPTMKG